jgi:hypothetical protein
MTTNSNAKYKKALEILCAQEEAVNAEIQKVTARHVELRKSITAVRCAMEGDAVAWEDVTAENTLTSTLPWTHTGESVIDGSGKKVTLDSWYDRNAVAHLVNSRDAIIELVSGVRHLICSQPNKNKKLAAALNALDDFEAINVLESLGVE